MSPPAPPTSSPGSSTPEYIARLTLTQLSSMDFKFSQPLMSKASYLFISWCFPTLNKMSSEHRARPCRAANNPSRLSRVNDTPLALRPTVKRSIRQKWLLPKRAKPESNKPEVKRSPGRAPTIDEAEPCGLARPTSWTLMTDEAEA